MGRAVLLCALGAEPVKGGRDVRALAGLNAQCPTAIAAGHCGVRGLCFFLFPFFFSLSSFPFAVGLLSFGAAVVACTSDIGTYVGVVAEAGWGVVDERAYLISHDGDGVLAE